MSTLPRFSVLICNYNYAQFVARAIRSALGQDYPAELLQVVVVDDGSTDGSLDVYAQFQSDPRFVLVTQPNRGQSAAFEAGVQAATGDYVCLLDSDDFYLPTKLRRVAAHIATLDVPAGSLFLCHDLVLEDSTTAPPTRHPRRWFDMVGIDEMADCTTLADPVRHFPYSVPCGLVLARPLIAACLAALPTWAFPRGTDGILCPTAMLKAGQVHYLREALGVYCIHGGNEFASLVGGQYLPRRDPGQRAPRTLHFLEQWIDLLDQPAPQRALAQDYLRRLEHLGRRLSASRRTQEPQVQIVVLAEGPQAAAAADASASHSLQSHAATTVQTQAIDGASELDAIAQAYLSGSADYLVLVRAGDRLDREFVERHLRWRQHGALVAMSCSDVRLVDAQGGLLHSAVMRNSGAWKQALQQVPPLATGLADWVAPPMSACMFRRTAFLDAVVAQRHTLPPALQQAGFWLLFQLQHHTGGVLRMLDTLGTCRLADGAAASYAYLSAPSGVGPALTVPPVRETVDWLRQFYASEPSLFSTWLPPAWHQRFSVWLDAQAAAADRATAGLRSPAAN